MPSFLKRKSNPEAPHAPSKRLRTDGLFTPRVKAPTGACRFIPRASRYQPSSASPAKRTLDEEHVEQGLSSKVRILNNRGCLHLLPSRKPLPMPAPELQRKIKPRSPLKNAIIARLSRRRAILLQKQKLERLMERMDSDNVYYFSEGLSDGIKLFTSRSPASFSSFSVDVPDLEMGVEEPRDYTTTITSGSPSQPASDPESPTEEIIRTKVHEEGASRKSGDADEESAQEPESRPEGRTEEEKGSMKDTRVGPEEEKDLMKDDDEAEEKGEDKKEASETLSTKDRLVSDRIKEKLGEGGMVCLSVKIKKAVEEDKSTLAKKSPTKKKVKVVLPPTLEEDEDEEGKGPESPKKRNSRPSSPQRKREEADDSSDSGREDQEERPRRRSLRSGIRKSEGGEKEEKEEEKEEKEMKGPEDPEKKASQPKPKHEYEDSNPSDTEKDDDKRKQEEGEEAAAQVDRMEEDADVDTESAGSSGEDTDMSTDDEAPTETTESTEEEDVAMCEDGNEARGSRHTEDEKKGEERQEKEDEADNDDNEESPKLIKTDSKSSDEEAKKPKRVKSLVLSSQPEEVEAVSAPKTPSSAATLRYNFSITKTPKSPRSPRLFKHDLVPSSPIGFSSLSKKKKTLLKPEIERDASLWMLGKSNGLHPKRRRQRPFIPANVSRHAYRDSDFDDGEDMYTHHHHGFQSSRRENDETEDDDIYLRVDWPWDGRGRYSSWMMEHGGPLLEFCVRGLEGFNMAW